MQKLEKGHTGTKQRLSFPPEVCRGVEKINKHSLDDGKLLFQEENQ